MRKELRKILVTGGAGFIGSAFVRLLLNNDAPRGRLSLEYKVIVVDKLTYAGDLARLKGFKGKYSFYKADICDKKRLEAVFEKESPDSVVHFAAETHVDRSIINSTVFTKTNFIGTQVLLDLSRKFGLEKFVHISTDEVYGEIKSGKFTENSPIKPNSPYAASKAAADLLIRSYIRTYDFPAVIIRPSNNYGPWQYPEKFIPVIISKALDDQKVPVYAKGLNKREWLYVSDCAKAVLLILRRGGRGEVYNVGSCEERSNIDVVRNVLALLGRPLNQYSFVKDRPGHDFRYSLDFSKVRKLGWQPLTDFKGGIAHTIQWYKANSSWLNAKSEFLKEYWSEVYKT